MPLIAPSLLAADFLKLGEECRLLNRSSADWFHLDIMDGRFVPNISYGLPVVEAIRTATEKTLDVHLMILEPERYAEAFAKAGANVLTVHLEACIHLHRNLQQIRSLGMKAGVALNPHTPVDSLQDVLGDLDLVLIMSVNPGFGGQAFIEGTYRKVEALRRAIDDAGADVLIQIDGGVSTANAAALVRAGADVLVAGSAVFKAPDPEGYIAQLKSIQ